MSRFLHYKMKRLTAGIAGIFVAASMMPPVWAQTSDPAWLDELTAQALVELNCEVVYFMSMREQELGGKMMHEARIQCADGRQFDAQRTSPEVEFTFRKCDKEVC